MASIPLSIIVITKNEQRMIADCLASAKFASELIVVDTGNTDATNAIARKFGARIVTSTGQDYSQFRNSGTTAATGNWLFFLDADERITPELASELIGISTSSKGPFSAYDVPRTNVYLGRIMHYGGWGGDRVRRLFHKQALVRWQGALHEQPVVRGRVGTVSSSLLHLSHRDLSSMVEKTLVFTSYEASLRIQAHHPPIVWWRFLRVMGSEFWHRFISLSAYRDGTAGIIDGIFQVFNIFIIYARVWELQHSRGKIST